MWKGPPAKTDASTTDETAEDTPTPLPHADVALPPPSEPTTTLQPDTPTPAPELSPQKPTFNRYYHLFRHGELTSLVQLAAAELGGVFVSGIASSGAGETTGGTSYVLECSLEGCAERWERENWVVEINVRWRRL